MMVEIASLSYYPWISLVFDGYLMVGKSPFSATAIHATGVFKLHLEQRSQNLSECPNIMGLYIYIYVYMYMV